MICFVDIYSFKCYLYEKHNGLLYKVITKDSQRRIKVINGVSLEKTTYPLRKVYRTKNNTKSVRKEEQYTQFVKQFGAISGDIYEDRIFFYIRKDYLKNMQM